MQCVSEEKNDWSQVPFFKSQRFVITLVTFFSLLFTSFQMVNLSMAIVCMVKDDITHSINNEINMSTTIDNYPNSSMKRPSNIKVPPAKIFNNMSHSKDDIGEFAWSKELQGILLSAYGWGYLVLQIPGGRLSERYGPRIVVFCTMLPVAVLTLLSPVIIRFNPYCFLLIRILIGFCDGAIKPSSSALLARWVPPSERGRLVGGASSGIFLGNAITFPFAAFLCSSYGWEWVFYVFGILGFIWCLLWISLISDSPELSPYISDLELRYIQTHTTHRNGQQLQTIPWRSILTSLPFWAIAVGHTCFDYCFYMMITEIPTYLKEVLKFDLEKNGNLSMLPWLTMYICIGITGPIADMLITKNILTPVWTRRLMVLFGSIIPALCMFALAFLDDSQQVLAIILLSGCVGVSGIQFQGLFVNHLDIAPQFSGTLFGMTNFLSSISGIIAPFLVSAITPNGTSDEWRIAFLICVAIIVFGGVFYSFLAKASVQSWAKTPISD